MKKNVFTNKTVFTKCIMSATIICASVFSTHSFAQGKWEAPSSANSIKNPLAGNAEAIKNGKTLYITNCAPCHGERGKGDGPAAGALNPKPANHSSLGVQTQTDGAIFWKMSEGRGAMAAYKNNMTEQQRWSLVCYIRTLKK